MNKRKLKRILCLIAGVLITLTGTGRAAAPAPGPAFMLLSHDLDVTVDIKGRNISGTDKVTLRKEARGLKKFSFYIRDGSAVESIAHNGRPLPFRTMRFKKNRLQRITVKMPETNEYTGPEDKGPMLVIRFNGRFDSIEKARGNLQRGVAHLSDGVIGPAGAFLPSGSFWYPREIDEFALFNAAFTLPRGFTSITEGGWIDHAWSSTESVDRWRTSMELDGLNLVTARFKVEREIYKGVDLYTFFLSDDKDLSELYINKTKGYLDLYSEMLGPYPFKKFAVVESFLPTGYGMPSFTLLGSMVLRLPFIPDISLGHEVAHNWFGNSVFTDATLGNWSEALTTFVADYLYAKEEGKAVDFRLDKLRGYKSFAGKSALALRDFNDTAGAESRAVGYNKGLMVFNMLSNMLGTETFGRGLKKFYSEMAFKNASWRDLQRAFEEVSGKKLDWFFDQWLERSGGPVLSLKKARIKKRGDGFLLKFRIRQHKPAYTMSLPVSIDTAEGVVKKEVVIKKGLTRVSIELGSRPLAIEIDPGYENFRILSDSEVPPSFGTFFGDRSGVIIVPERFMEKYGPVATLFKKDYGQKIVNSANSNIERYLEGRPLLILGGPGENPAFGLLKKAFDANLTVTPKRVEVAGKGYDRAGIAVALAAKNTKPIILFFTDTGNEETLKAAKRLRYYLPKSYVVFPAEGPAAKGLLPGGKALFKEFKEP